MVIALTHDLQELVERRVQSGLYRSASDVVREALLLLEKRDNLNQTRLAELREQIAAGIEHMDQGGLVDEAAVFEAVQGVFGAKLGDRG